MTRPVRTRDKRRTAPGPARTTQLGNPLDFLLADHLLEREVCSMLDRIATATTPDPEDLAEARSFLAKALPPHLADEDEDLFPLLRLRCRPEDEIGRAISRLTRDHGKARQEAPRIADLLARLAASGGTPTSEERGAIAAFADKARGHLVFENAVMLPIARSRLTPADLDRMRQGMLVRRGLDRLLEQTDAG